MRKDDPKIILLIEQLGLEGYGIFWILVETLRDQKDFTYPLKLIPALSRRYNTTSEKMKTVVLAYELFVIADDKIFYSESLLRRMKIYQDKRKKLSNAGKKGNEIRWGKKIALQSGGDSLAIASKVNEKKVNKNKSPLLLRSIEDDESLRLSLSLDDSINRNWQGLKRHLDSYKLSDIEYQKIAEESEYGEIGHPIWQVVTDISTSNGKIHSPAKFLMSKLFNQE